MRISDWSSDVCSSDLYQPATYTCSWLFMSQDRSRDMLHWGMIGSTMTAISIVAAVPFGPVAVAASYSLSGLLVRLPALFWMVGRRGPVSKTGKASCRGRVCQYVSNTMDAATLKK